MIYSDFRWATGIECSFIPHLGIDQYRWTQHDRFWRADFELIANDLGCRWLRYALPWHEIEPQPGQFDWRWFDERLGLFEQLGITPMVDLAHFGVPTWLPDAFADADFPAALERFARAFGERYAGRVKVVCPVNEPLITSLFCGDIGLWPPYGRGLNNYMTVLSRVAQAVCRATRALRATMPGVEILVCDSLEVAVTFEDSDETTSPFLKESLRSDVTRRMHRRHIVTDLILGRVNAHHPLLPWLQKHGLSDFDVHWFQRNAQTIDLIGLDYYEHTEVELYTTAEGYYRQRELRPPVGLYAAAQDYWNKYHVPLMVTETSVGGHDGDKIAWLERSVADVRRLRAEGFPLIGYTWWPAIDHLDWDGALLHQTGHIHPVGIYRLERRPGGRLERIPTGLRDAYRALVEGGNATAGPLVETDAQRDQRAARAAAVAASRPAALGWPVIAHGTVPWSSVAWHREQHIFSRLSKRHRVLYVEPPVWSEGEEHPRSGLGFHPMFPNLFSLSMHLPAALGNDPKTAGRECRRLLAETLAQPPLAGQFEGCVHWFTDPAAGPLFMGHFEARATVYDGADLVPEPGLLAHAATVFAAGHGTEEAIRAAGGQSVFVRDGVAVREFARTRSRRVAVPNDINFVPRPILGYIGVIDTRLDYALIAALAESDANWSIVMVGPVTGIDPEQLPRRKNIFWIGPRAYGEMPDYAYGFQVCLAPFALTDATRLHDPQKIGEYLMAGREVVSTDLPEVGRGFEGLVSVAGSHEEFIAACRRAVDQPDPEAIQRGRRAMAKHDWKHTVAAMERQVEAMLANRLPAPSRGDA